MTNTFRFISAGAGSGKTYRLADLLHELLIGGRVRPSGVIATSFTNKSAAELRERVRAHLIGKGRFALATAIGQSRIGTVNSVCGNLLARFAFEAGLPPEQRVLDETQARQLLTEATDEVIEGETLTRLLEVAGRLSLDSPRYGQETVPWRAALAELVRQARANGIEPAQLRAHGDRNADGLLAFLPAPSARDLDAELRSAVNAALVPVREAATQGGTKITAQYLRELERAAQELEAGELSWTQWNSLASKQPEAALRSVVQPVKDAAAASVSHPGLHADLRTYLGTIFALAADVLDTYAARKRQLGAIDFTDQERELLNIIDDPAVAGTLRAELDLLMVDEFQDTSPLQLALFLKLGQLAKHVVWVGDVKQAIYGFRGGDAKLMTAVLGKLPELRGEKEILPFSWRSRPSLVALVNDLFTQAFPSLAADDVRLTAKRPDYAGTPAIEDWLLEGNASDQYAALGCGIRALIDEGTVIVDRDTGQPRALRLGDIAVLARSNHTVKALARELRSQRIAAATEQPGLLQCPEVVLALACLRRLNDERDTIATAEILSLADCTDPDIWLTERLAWVESGAPPGHWREHAADAQPLFQVIRELRLQRPLLSPAEAIGLILARCGLSRLVLQWQQSPAQARVRLANLARLTEIVAEYEDECRSGFDVATLSGFLLWLRELETAGQDVLAQPSIDAVRVMTHHGAKGLEWPVVVLMDLAGKVKESTFDAVRASALMALDVADPLRNRFIRYWPWPFGAQNNNQITQVVDGSSVGQALRLDAVDEHQRLLYVSLTRARDLIVLARDAKKPDGEWMQTIGLAQRLPADDHAPLPLGDGTTVPFRRRRLSAGEVAPDVVASGRDLRWFGVPDRLTPKLPLTVSPSDAAGIAARVTEVVTIGTRLVIGTSVDAAALGSAVHACLAQQLVSPEQALAARQVEEVLVRLGVAGAVDPAQLATRIHAVHQWLMQRWPEAQSLVEVPVSRMLANGQQVSGRIDLLLRTPAGWIVFDHKATPQNSSQWGPLAQTYGGQLIAYREALEAVTGSPVTELWLVLPVAGSALRIESAPEETAA